MSQTVDRFRTVPQPPIGAYPVLALLATGGFAVAFPFGLDVWPDVALEGVYLGLALLIGIPIRRLGVGVLEIGWMLFLFGRYIDFLDEVFAEPEPIVEPYLSGLVMVVSFAVIFAGAYAVLVERREQVDRLEARNEELELKNTAIEEAPVGITIADMTQESEPLIAVNEGFTRLTGYDADKTVGENCRFLQGEDTSDEAVAEMRAAIENGESVEVTIRNYRKDGTMFWNDITLAPLERAGEVPHYVGFQQDVTDRMVYEQRLQDQRDSLHLLSQMVRHDIRNDLQVIIGRVDVLATHLDADGQALLNTVEERTEHAIELTETARELGETVLDDDREQGAVSLTDAINDQIAAVQSTFGEATIERTGPIPEVSVEADGMLDSVFRNLLKNAVQHNTADVPEVSVSVTEGADNVTTRIADNGPGIPDERKAAVFGEGEKGIESEGTGIGTYLVETLVTQYGGDVWIEDNEPSGAVFAVELPKAG